MRVVAKNARETIRVEMAEFRGISFLEVRTWVDTGNGEPKPTRQGVTVPLALVIAFVDAVAHRRQGGAP